MTCLSWSLPVISEVHLQYIVQIAAKKVSKCCKIHSIPLDLDNSSQLKLTSWFARHPKNIMQVVKRVGWKFCQFHSIPHDFNNLLQFSLTCHVGSRFARQLEKYYSASGSESCSRILSNQLNSTQIELLVSFDVDLSYLKLICTTLRKYPTTYYMGWSQRIDLNSGFWKSFKVYPQHCYHMWDHSEEWYS